MMKVKLGIIAAMDLELELIKNAMEIKETKEISGITYYFGKFFGVDTVAAVSGVGKVFAAIATEAMILNYNPEIIVNSGVAGGLLDTLSRCDAVIATSLVQHDMDTSALGDPVGLISGINVVNFDTDKEYVLLLEEASKKAGVRYETGVIASGDQFISSDSKKEYLKSTFNAIACEMEGASVAHVSYVNGVKFLVLRTISDGGDDSANIDFPVFCRLASEKSFEIMKNFAEAL